MNWGYKILIVIVLFIAGMGLMVSIAMKQKNEMIDEQYYVKELKHQGQIDAENNLNALTESLVIKDSSNFLALTIPSSARQNISDGSIIFLRPSDKSKDRNIALATDANGQQLLDKSLFVKGQYKVRVSWKSDDKPYYYEQSFFVN
jgi:hypothetical protein